MSSTSGYLSATRHPWPCLWFLLPLLAVYEVGVFYLGGTQAQAMRNGADAWLRWGLEVFGVKEVLAAPAFVIVILFLWCLRKWSDRPNRTFSLLFGMTLESLGWAAGLWTISQNFDTILGRMGVTMEIPPVLLDERVGKVITFIGAGIYEEVLFRLVIFGGLVMLLRFAEIPSVLAVIAAAVISSLLFAGAHHIGPYGEPFERIVFLFRMVAGLYFTVIFYFRGFGIAVGSHAIYDVLVGLRWQ
jgi:membrane protease YdiL (CAAX protease family)